MTRDEITAALATVPELDAKASVPDVIVAGAAWPAWAGARPQETLACIEWHSRWQAYVALGSGTRADSATDLDAMLATVGEALYAAGLPIELAEAVDVQIAPGATDTIPALRFTLAE